MINPAIFREYDIRGIADADLPDEKVYRFGRGLGTYYRSHGEVSVVVGRDMRISSPRIAATLKKGLVESGCSIVDIGMVPTPVFYFSLFHYNINCGVMVTASHNPKEFNGFKINRDKISIYGEEIQKIRQLIEKGEFAKGKGIIRERDIVPQYIDYVVSKVMVKHGLNLKVVVDTGNGTCGPVIDRILARIGIDYQILFKEPDGNFPNHLPDPTVIKHITKLIETVKNGDFCCGIGFDGDGDRIGVLDESGEIIWGDVLLAIYAEPVIKSRPGAKIIFEVKCSKGLTERITELGGIPIMYKTGHSLIKAKMKEEHAPLAGEMSGHIFFADRYYGYDDALYAGLRLLEILSAGEKLSTLARKVPKYFSTPEIRIETSDEEKFKIVNKMKKYFMSSYRVIDIDGVRVDFSDGWGLIRASNTQPVLVLRFEAKSESKLDEIRKIFFDQLEILRK